MLFELPVIAPPSVKALIVRAPEPAKAPMVWAPAPPKLILPEIDAVPPSSKLRETEAEESKKAWPSVSNIPLISTSEAPLSPCEVAAVPKREYETVAKPPN